MKIFVVAIRIEFVWGLLSGFTKPPFRIWICCTWTHVAMVRVVVL